MKLQTVKWIAVCLMVLGGILFLAGTVSERMALRMVGLGLMFGAFLWKGLFYRCPHCDQYLHRSRGEYCPYCGRKVNK